MAIVKVDAKGRIRLPSELRNAWKLKPKQSLLVTLEGEKASVKRFAKPTPKTDPLLRDIMINPLRAPKGVKITKKLLEKWEDEAWTP